MSSKTEVRGRRQFLKTAAVAGGAATVAVATGGAVAEKATPAGQAVDATVTASQGYRVTPHIETYYRLARR